MEENFGVENPLEKVEEQIKEIEGKEQKLENDERERSKFNSIIAISISIFAVITAFIGLNESQITTDTLLKMDEAVLLQSKASDQWAYYQAKSIKGELYKGLSKSLVTEGNPKLSDAKKEFDTNASRYDTEKKDIEKEANLLEKQKDEKLSETSNLVHKHHSTGIALTFMQISIVLASVSSLLRKKYLWFASIGTSVVGVVYFLSMYLHH